MQFSLFPRRTAALCLLLAAAGAAAGIAFGLTAAQPPPLYEAAGPVHVASSAAPSAARSEPGSAGTSAPASESALPPMVCLTFDDGPSRTTPAVHEALAADSASHRYSDIYRSTDAFWADIELLRQRIAPYADAAAVSCLRFPGGSTNTVSRKYGGDAIMQDLKAQAEARGWRWVDWNVSAEDAAGKKLSAEEICRNVTRGSEGRDRCIVLMHDSATTGTTAEALPAIIRWYKENGYAFCTVSQLYDALE